MRWWSRLLNTRTRPNIQFRPEVITIHNVQSRAKNHFLHNPNETPAKNDVQNVSLFSTEDNG